MASFKLSCDVWLVILAVLVAVLLRAITTLHPYSGAGKPPMFGDYEAQRHWMEITSNLPVDQWYRNSSHNDLLYWGLDYPPLTAYHMLGLGKIGELFNDNYTRLGESRGFESAEHKLFMRLSVLVVDIGIYIPALVLYYFYFYKCSSLNERAKRRVSRRPLPWTLSIIISLLYPGIILIDHGHFQYNCVSLGLFVYAVVFLLLEKNLVASLFFCLALNYKQMELYHALPFFVYLLSSCVPKPGHSPITGFVKLSKIALVVVSTFAIIWLPFLTGLDSVLAVVDRLFPVTRGVFEDKVSNVWCVVNIFYKLKSNFDNLEMMRLCLFSTFAAILPSCMDLFLRPNLAKFVLSLINCSMGFFLFSFQVHEKSILLVAVPVLLDLPHRPFTCFWFLCLSVFSMLPLLAKDGLVVASVALTIFFATAFRVSIEHLFRNFTNFGDGLAEYYRSLWHIILDIEYKTANKIDAVLKVTYKEVIKNGDALRTCVFHFVMLASLSGCVVLGVVSVVATPPPRYPDLFALVISAYSALHFLGFFVYFNVRQMRIPQAFDDARSVRVKSD